MAYISFQPKDYFNTVLYNGTGSSQSITGVGFQPDWLWQKSRSNTQDGRIFDAVRGGSKLIYPSLTNAESTDAQLITSFDSDGFTMGSSGSNVNDSGTTNVAWNWRASNTTAVSNTDGSITSTVSANTTSGFSIVKYGDSTGTQTVGHGLGSDVKVLIIKNLTSATNWHVWHTGIATSAIHLNETNAKTDSWFSYYQNSTAPTSSVFTVKSGNGDDALGSSKDYVAYCFAEKKGFSKFGSYTGNGNADGAFIYTGFKPAFIIIKNADDGSKNWVMLDNKRPSTGQNPADDILFPNTSGAESSSQTDRLVDFVSNGIKIRGNSLQMNASGQKFIFMAFAEAPLVSSNGVPNTAK